MGDMSRLENSVNGEVSEVVGNGLKARKVNNLLNTCKSRVEGLELLSDFLEECSEEDFTRYCVSWMQNCCKTDSVTKNKDYASYLLNELLKTSSKCPELKKSVSFFITTRYFDFFLKHLLHSQAGWTCTETCMLHYRGACGPFQESLEKHLKNEIGRNVKISATVAHCCALLPSVGGGGNEGISWKKNWRSQFVKFLNVCHSLLSDLFADVEELQEYETPQFTYDKTKCDSTPDYLAIQIHNHCTVLNYMLLNQYPAPKSIPTDLVFHLISRGLAITSKALAKRQTSHFLLVQKVLPEVHCSLLSLLKALVVTCKNHLLPYAHLVCKLISQTLEWTKSVVSPGSVKPFGQLKLAAYEVLCNWLAATGNGSCAESISNTVISSGVSDVWSKERVVCLKEAKRQNQWKGGEQTRQGLDTTVQEEVCSGALKALQFLLKYSGASLNEEEHKCLQEVAVKLLVEVQRSASDMMVPFGVDSCRLGLYTLLLELILHPCPKWPPPTHYALRLFSKGMTDTSPRISSFCSMASSVATVIIHPQYCNGGFPTCEERPEERNQREVQLQWKEVPQVEMEVATEIAAEVEDYPVDSTGTVCENAAESPEPTATETKLTTGDSADESEPSADEDSTHTVSFSETPDAKKDNLNEVEETEERPADTICPPDDEPSPKIRRTEEEVPADEEETPPPSSPSTVAEPQTKTVDSDQSEPAPSAKSLSPESTGEELSPKKRYFLRSKTKGSSEEPEEAVKRVSGLETPKSTPKGSPFLTGKKRPRTRALSKVEATPSGAKTPKAGVDEDEDILAVFEDSLVS